ncbi:MAG TPA: DUF6350 family protein, partial [Nakamurella sp.]|nr:DUF6350 family protein [Nakamurella sp.]
MTQLAPERIAPPGNPLSADHPNGLVAAAAAVRGAAVAISGLIFTAGIALVVWAITPASGAEAGAAMRAGVAGFALANLMPISVAGTVLTLPPLLLTGLIVALLTSVARHGRYLPQGRAQEALAVLVSAGTYGLIVAATTRGFGPPEAIPAWSVWTATAIALCAVAAGTIGRESAWGSWWRGVTPAWVHTGARGGAVGLGVLIAGGGLALVAALVTHFGSAVSVSALAAPTWTDGLGLALLGIVYVPNAVVAGAGYLTGVGFVVGPGTYSPFSSSIVELPAVPLLAATPDHSGVSPVGIALMLVPLLAGGLIGWRVVRQLTTRQERAYAAAVASAAASVGVGALAWIASGGVGDGRWATMGSPPLLTAGAAFVEVGVVAVGFAAFAQAGSVPWRVVRAGVEDDDMLDSVVTDDFADDDDELLDADGSEVNGLDEGLDDDSDGDSADENAELDAADQDATDGVEEGEADADAGAAVPAEQDG